MKRLIGRSFDEPEVQEEIKGLPFKVKATPSGGIAYEVTYDGETKLFTPEQVRGGLRPCHSLCSSLHETHIDAYMSGLFHPLPDCGDDVPEGGGHRQVRQQQSGRCGGRHWYSWVVHGGAEEGSPGTCAL